jgi:hypothetical protein
MSRPNAYGSTTNLIHVWTSLKSGVQFSMLLLFLACGPARRPESFRAMVYSPAFADRFKLSARGVYTLAEGLQAVAIRVVDRAGAPPDCLLDLYLDDSLDLAYPEGSEGKRTYDDDLDPLFFVKTAEALGSVNHRWDARLGNFHAITCRQTPSDCLFEEGSPEAFSRHLLSGLSLLTYGLACYELDPKYGPTEIWLLRAGRDPHALNVRSTDTTATYRFAIPPALVQHAADSTRKAAVASARPWPDHALSVGRFTVPTRHGE